MTDWQTIVHSHKGAVWRTAYRLLGNTDEAADGFQETFLAALQLARREPVRSWPALLGRLATRRALDRLRKRIRDAGRHEDLADWTTVASGNPGPVQEAQATELSARLRKALTQLPPQQAEVFCLRSVNDLSYREIARQLDLKTSAVGVLLHRARSRLRELLGPAPATRPRQETQETEVSS